MSLTPSTMMELGTVAPDFALPEVLDGKIIRLSDFDEQKALLVVFICAHCPFVKLVENELAAIGSCYLEQGLGMIAICSNDTENYPDDAPDKLEDQAERAEFIFPYCIDRAQDIAKAYHAACTPDIYLFDENRKLVYRGQIDDARPGNGKPVTGKNLRAAINEVLSGIPVTGEQFPATGCNIKWKPGSEPAYFG